MSDELKPWPCVRHDGKEKECHANNGGQCMNAINCNGEIQFGTRRQPDAKALTGHELEMIIAEECQELGLNYRSKIAKAIHAALPPVRTVVMDDDTLYDEVTRIVLDIRNELTLEQSITRLYSMFYANQFEAGKEKTE